MPLEVTSGLQRLVSIVDEQRPSGTPAALQALNFDFSSISGIDLLRGALGVGGDSEVVIAVSAEYSCRPPAATPGLGEKLAQSGLRDHMGLTPEQIFRH